MLANSIPIVDFDRETTAVQNMCFWIPTFDLHLHLYSHIDRVFCVYRHVPCVTSLSLLTVLLLLFFPPSLSEEWSWVKEICVSNCLRNGAGLKMHEF